MSVTVDIAPATRFARPTEGFAGVASRILEVLELQLPGGAFFVGQFDRDGDVLRYVDARGGEAKGIAAGSSMALSESFCIRMADHGAPNLSNRPQEDEAYRDLEAAAIVDSYAGVALRVGDAPALGSLCAVADERDAFSQADLDLITMLGRLLEHELERDFRSQTENEMEAALREAASTDALTEIANRRRFEFALEFELAEIAAGRRPEATLVLIDLDDFKPINDIHGHAAGDDVLRAVARALESCSRSGDLVARHGGDEFTAILRDTSGDHGCEEFVARLATRLSAAAPGGEPVGFSWGCATLVAGVDAESAVGRADRRMYERKRSRPHALDAA